MANEKRLINAEAIARKLKKAYCAECNVVRRVQCSACWVDDVLEMLEVDSVDAVEVVRCKDCKHYKTITCSCGCNCVHDKWYCADGERRTE